MSPNGPPVIDWADLKRRVDSAEAKLNALQIAYTKLTAQALALVWYVPDDVRCGDVKTVADMLLDLMRRDAYLEAENAALRANQKDEAPSC